MRVHDSDDSPLPRTPLIGREREAAAIASLLIQGFLPVVTLTGPGGVGKTRLAHHVAAKVKDDFDEVFFVSLAAIRDASLVESEIARGLDVRGSIGRTLADGLKARLANSKTLLVLYNFEQVAPAAMLVAELVAALPNLRLLITSRLVLRLSVEQVFPVSPLMAHSPTGEDRLALENLAQIDAVTLFLQRTRAVDPGFTLTETNAEAVLGICQRLDGLPLAIELAAARTSMLPPIDILRRLSSPLSLLTGGARDAPAR